MFNFQEHVSGDDKNYRSNGMIDIDSLKIAKITDELIEKYQEDFKFLKRIRNDDDIEGRLFFRRDDLLLAVTVEKHSDGHKWIQAIEIDKDKKGYGLGIQGLDYAVKKLGAQYISVSKNNTDAQEQYEKYGFRKYKETKSMVYYTLNPDQKDEEYVPRKEPEEKETDNNTEEEKSTDSNKDVKFKDDDNKEEKVEEACKDIKDARKLVSDVRKLAKKHDANFFFVTDGASGYSNGNGKTDEAVKNARNEQIKWEKKNGFDPDEDWAKNESFILESFKLIKTIYPVDNKKNYITSEFIVKDIKGIDNILCKVNGFSFPFRGRSELLIFNKDKVFIREKNNDYRIPGGGWEIGEDHKLSAIREAQEEARINTKNVNYFSTYLNIYNEPVEWVVKKIPNKDDRWKGYYTELYIGEYDSNYSGSIDKVDQDKDMTKNGKFVSISSIYNRLSQQHKDAVDFYLDSLKESFASDKAKELLSESLVAGDTLYVFNEDTNDVQLKRLLFKERIKKRKDLLLLYDKVKEENPFIKFTFPDISRYVQKNIFIDTYYYMDLFFKNNTWALARGLKLFTTFMKRVLNFDNLKKAGYKKNTIMIPVNDWDKTHDGNVWNFKKSLNPISMIYYCLFKGQLTQLKNIFGDNDILFIGSNCYFKLNFSQVQSKECKKLAMKFKKFVIKICKNEEFEPEDIDTTADNTDSPEVIKAKVIDKIEASKGIDLTATMKKVDDNSTDNKSIVVNSTSKQAKAINANLKKDIKSDTEEIDKVVSSKSKLSANQTTTSDIDQDMNNKETEERLARAIKSVADNIDSNSEEDAMVHLDNDEIKQMILDLGGEDDKVNITPARAARISELDKKLLATKLGNKSIDEILNEKPKEIPKVDINVSSPNEEEWKDMSYMNFDKDYDINKDIIACFRHFENVTRPISITNIDVSDNSTSEDRLSLYTVKMEDYNGKRFTVKLDIPIMKDNRFLLRGNSKSINTQFFNIPIIKTDDDTCQIISNYMKIFIRRFGTGSGKSNAITSRIIKALNKYTGNKIKVITGDNSRICDKYDLPIDYIDLAGIYSRIESPDLIIYFSQDEIREKYKDIIDLKNGIPYIYNKKNKMIEYIPKEMGYGTVSQAIASRLFDIDIKFEELYNSSARPTSSTYTRCSIMNTEIPLVVICAYHEGLRKTLSKASIVFEIVDKLTSDIRRSLNSDWLKFKDGYLVYNNTYEASLLLNGLKVCNTEDYNLADMDNKNMYLEFLDDFGGRIKADGLDNFYDLLVDPMSKEILEFYNLPTDYVTMLIYANNMLADNKYFKHTDVTSKRIRRYELIAAYTYKVLSDAYAKYANESRHGRQPEFFVKQSAVIDALLESPVSSDDSCINALRDVETTNTITAKGPSGMNSDRAYGLDKRTFDDSMVNVLGMSTGFSGNVGVSRQTTLNANIKGNRGFVVGSNGKTDNMNTANTLTATEALIPFGSTHDDPMRTAMSFIQTSKHQVRTEVNDPPLVVNGAEEAMPYITTDRFAFKAKQDGKVIEYKENDYAIIEYKDKTKDYIDLNEEIEKNSDGGYYVPMKIDVIKNFKVGKTFKANDILAYDKYSFDNSVGESDNLAYMCGKLSKIAILNSDECFEDSAAITESLANELATRVDLKFDVRINKDTNIISMMNVGDHVEAAHPLLVWQTPFEDEDANALMKALASSEDEVSELGKRTLESGVTGTITDIKIFRTVDVSELSPSLKKIVNAYEKPYKEKINTMKKHGLSTSNVRACDKLEPVGKLKKCEDCVLFEFYVEYMDTVGIGDKVVFYSANKGVTKTLIPTGKEPYTEFRPNESIDAFVGQISIDKRMVTSTMIYGSLQKLMIELDRSVKDIMGIPYDDSKA